MLTLTSPRRTWAHKLPVGVKLAALAGATMALFAVQSSAVLGIAAAGTALLVASGGGGFLSASMRSLRMLWPFVVIVALWHLWQSDPAGIAIVLRMLCAVALANFVTMTTRLSDMIGVLEWLARPFARLIPPQRLALAIALTIRFIPVMALRAEEITTAWRARSPRPARWRILPALTLAALDDSARTAEALRARGGVQ